MHDEASEMGEKNILKDPREVKKAWNLEVKPSITLVLRRTPKAEVSFISSVLLLLMQAFPMTGNIIQGWVMSKNSSFWGRQERALHHLPLVSVRPALWPQITLSSVCQVSPESTISLKGHGNRKLSGLSYFCVRRKNQLLMWSHNLQPHHSSRTPEFLLFSKSNLLMPDFCFKSFCSLLIVYEINEWMSPLSPFLLCTYLKLVWWTAPSRASWYLPASPGSELNPCPALPWTMNLTLQASVFSSMKWE